jgi:hypothetical protein
MLEKTVGLARKRLIDVLIVADSEDFRVSR